jgi:hypothetical protein
MSQTIEAPNESDIGGIAQQLIHAGIVVKEVTGKDLSGSTADLPLLQATLDANVVEPEATYTLQALGIAFGKVFIENNGFYDWCMVEDEYGRDPAVRYKRTTLLVFPQTMISKRVEDGEPVEVQAMYEALCQQLEDIRRENYPD